MCVQSTVNAAPAIRLLQLALCVFMAVAADCVGLLRHQQQQLSRPHPAWDAGHLPPWTLTRPRKSHTYIIDIYRAPEIVKQICGAGTG